MPAQWTVTSERPVTADNDKAVLDVFDPSSDETKSSQKWEVKSERAIDRTPVPPSEIKLDRSGIRGILAPTTLQNANEFERQLGLTAKIPVDAVTQIADFFYKPASQTLPWIYDKYFSGKTKAPESLTQMADKFYPQTKNSEERIVQDIGTGMVGGEGILQGAKAMGKVATSPVTKKVLDMLAENPNVQRIANATGATAGSVTKELGGGGFAQLLATLVGGMTPVGIEKSVTSIPSVLRGQKTPQQVQNTVRAFKNVGAQPSVGQATENSVAQGFENVISKTPGAGAIGKRAKEQQESIGNKVDQVASSLSPKASGEAAGRDIVRGIEGSGNDSFINKTRGVMNQLYNKLDSLLSPEKRVGVSNFTKALSDINAPIKGAPALSKTSLLSNKSAEELEKAVHSDIGVIPAKASNILDEYGIPYQMPAQAGDGLLPYQSLKETRTRIGEKIDNSGLDPNVNIKELRRLYGALSQDMEAAAKAQGSKAEKAFHRANNYTKARFDRLDNIRNVVERNGGPEKVFQAAISGTGEGATTFRSVMKSLPKEEQKTLVSTVLRRLGRATPGKQNDIGSEFSTETFLTNWNRLSPEAKSTMAGAMGSQYKKDMDTIAQVASNLRSGSKPYANPSGTASLETGIKTWGSLAAAGATFHLAGVAAVLTGMAGNRGAAKLMTNPDFVNWVATAPSKQSNWASHVARLTSIAESNEEDREDILAIQREMKNKLPSASSDTTGMPWQRNSLNNTLMQVQ